MSPVKTLLDRSSVWSFESLPSSGGIGPVILLFCNSLKGQWKPILSLIFKRERRECCTYTIWRFVKFPTLEERVPDRFWLGVPLHYEHYPPKTQFKLLKKKVENRRGCYYRPMTRLSGEQVTIVQLHGSTESPSQFSSTPWGSWREAFIPIRAWTEMNEMKQWINVLNRQTHMDPFCSVFSHTNLHSLHLWEIASHLLQKPKAIKKPQDRKQ